MSAAEAKNYHESLLKENGSTETDLIDGRRNPKARTISYWYEEWKKLNCNCPTKSTSETKSSEVSILQSSQITHSPKVYLRFTFVVIK